MTDLSEYTQLIGEISSAYGLTGQLWVFPHTDYPERFLELKSVMVGDKLLQINSATLNKGRVIVKFKGIDHINDAEKLKGERVYIKSADKIELNEDEYFYEDLMAMDVVTESGEDLDKIINIIKTGANDVYETDIAMIPAVKEFVKSIDIVNKKMVVIDRKGLKKADL